MRAEIKRIAEQNNWSPDWLNDAVNFHLSPFADRSADHVEFGSFPRGPGPYGLDILVPKAEYMLALKLKAMRVTDPVRGEQEAKDILNLLKVTKTKTAKAAMQILARYFPNSAKSPEKQIFLLKRLSDIAEPSRAPKYPSGSHPTRKPRRSGRDGAG